MVTMELLPVCVVLLSLFANTSEYLFRFTQKAYTVTIPENSAKNTMATTDMRMGVTVESGKNVSYIVVSGDPQGLFRVDARVVGDFGYLLLRTCTGSLNRERKDKYILTVRAAVHFSYASALHLEATVTVMVADTNDLSPLFYYPEFSATVPEDLPVHSSVMKVLAEDADLGRNGEVYYSFSEISENFAVHPVTGVVTLTRPLRYSVRSVYDLRVVAQDRGVEGSRTPSSNAKVRIVVTQVNLHGPEIYVYHLPEIVENSHADIYAIVRVIDRDDGVDGEVHSLEIVDGDEDGHFRITPVERSTTGSRGEEFNIEILKLAHKSSVSNRYNLTLRAIDKGTPPRTTYTSVPIKIKEYTFNIPVFDREIYEIDVSENTPINSSILRLKIEERGGYDTGQILLEIVGGNEAGEFSINPRTGVLYTAVQLDAEAKTFYTLTVSAVDHGAGWTMKQSSAKVKVQVVDTNDNDPQFDSPNSELWLSENEPAGTSAAKVTAKDRDSGENAYISYSIANLNPVPFEIDHFTGVVRTTKVLDYESMRKEYDLYIRASDWGTPFRRQSETRLKIRLKDVNDNKPLFEKTDCVGYLPRQVPVDTEVITLSAIDLDAGNIISYRIASGNEDGCFSLDLTSGMLSVACDLSDVGTSERHINVTAYDGTHYADLASVHIKLINSDRPRDFLVDGEAASFDCRDLGVAKRLTEVLALAEKNNGPKSREEDAVTLPNRYGTNSHAPQLISVPHEIQINESVPLGYSVIRVKAVDRDLGYNGKLIFGITSGDVDSTFSINQETGDIRVTGYLDRERRERYYLNVTVFDLGKPQLSCSRMLSIVILDVNDNAPVFDKNVVSFKVREDTPVGSEIFRFKATDNDLGENSHVGYEILTDTDDFQIDSRSGTLTVSRPLDRETRSSYELRIGASDRASDPNDPDALHSNALARVIVEDVNDEAPMFPSQTYLVKTREDVPVGTVVVTVDAWDPDPEEGGIVRYSIVNPAGDLPFSVDPETGTLRTTAALNYEERQMYSLTLRGEDQGVISLSAEVNLTIEITDVNENVHPPRFEDFVFSVRVRENLPVDTLVTTLVATDADPPGEDSRVSYRIVSGSGLGLFHIDGQGNIRTVAVLDRETTSQYWLTVVAYDHGVAPLSSRTEVFVTVEDENDNVPLSDSASYSGRVHENCPMHTSVVYVHATDPDPGEGISFNITAGNTARNFAIDDTGLIYTIGTQIDREVQDEYVLEVTLTDSGTPPLSSTVQVVIVVEDENDNSPQFDQTFYHIMIPEVQTKESTFIIQNEVDASESDLEFEALFVGETWHSLDMDNVTGHPIFRLVAVDSDRGSNGEVQYQVKASHGRFSIHPHTGVVFAQRPVLANQDFDLLVRASDQGSPQRRSTVRVSVHVLGPEGDGRPSTLSAPKPHFTRVTELDPVGYLVAVVQPPVLDGTIIWFSIVAGDPRDEFIIGVDSGSVQLARQLDCETQSLYNLTVSLSDSHRTVYTHLLVEVVDSNEYRPQFLQAEYKVSVAESAAPGTALVRLTATDSDITSQLIYSVHNSRSAASLQLFDLDHVTGQLSVAQSLDREIISEHVLTVVVSDSSSPVKRDFARVMVDVADTNDHAPQWSGGVVQADVLENSFVGSRVVTVVATDHDRYENAMITYAIVSGNVGNYFYIHPEMGDISVARELDCEETAEFNLIVRAVDHGSAPLASTLPVFITVRQSDHAPPRFEKSPAVAELEEDVPVGWIVWQAQVRSALPLTYHIEDGNTARHFTINPTTGVVTTRHLLDFETTPVYNLTVSATNMAGVKSQVSLIVDVVDCNDNFPRFLETEYRGSISEDAAPGSPVFTDSRSPLVVRAEDAESAILHYDIIESVPRRVFFIDPTTGAIRTQGRLDFEETESITFHVQVRDTGTPQLSGRDVAKVWVQVTDVNDCPPQFSQKEYNTTVLLPTFNNVSILQVEASDCDSPNITKLDYSIVTGNYENTYAISGSTGVISLRNKSRGVLKTPHRLKVSVSDGPHAAFAFVNINWEWSSQSTLRFQQEVYNAAIVENSTKIVTVAVVAVVGAELNEHILFSLLNPSPMFHVGRTSGAIRTTGRRFDREHQDHFQLIVQGHSETGGVELRMAQTLVNVSVLDINDNCPLFVGLPYYGTVLVDATKGDVITKVHAIDLDSGENGEVRYELMRGHGELFRVHRKTGEVILKQQLESQVREYQLSIAAYDGGMTPCSTEVWVHLTVVDKSLPLFDKQFYTAVVAEDVAAHTVVPVPLNTHTPLGMKLFYTIVAGNEYEIFTIDFGSGVLRVADELDFEDAQEHSLTVRATDLHSGVLAETLVKVKVTDVNDCHPEFPVNMYQAEVSEAAAPGTFVIKVEASDKDTGPGGVVRYSLKTLDGTTSDLFTIEPEDGSVYLKKSLDREAQSGHKLVVVATDTGIPNLSSTVYLWVKVLDINDNPPQFSHSVFVSQLSTEAVRGQFVCRVQARDPDLDRLQYTVVSRSLHNMFSIEPDTGVLQFIKLPKSLPPLPIELNVSVSDGVHMSFCTVVVDLLPSDHNAPVFLADHYEVTLPENMAEPSFLVLLAAEDTDSEGAIEGDVTYSLPSDKYNSMVSIDPYTGLLRSKKALDREKQPLHEILVMAADTSGHVGFTSVRLTVTDINDNVPTFLLPEYLACVPSNLTVNSAFLKVRATDADKGTAAQVMYTLQAPHQSEIHELFAVHPVSGTLYLQQPMLSLEGQVYQFFVRASDKGSPPLHSDVPVRVYIMDFADEPPVFQKTDQTFYVPEDAPLGYNITQLVLSSLLEVDYRLLTTGSQFSVSPDGWLYLSAPLDWETAQVHTLGAVAQSRSAPRLATLATVTVVVLDVNDNRPVFHSGVYHVSVAENAAVGTSIMRVEAEDQDDGRNGEVYYLLQNGRRFNIDIYTGWVMTSWTLEKAPQSFYNLTVVAMDNGSPALSSSVSLLIDIVDYNNYPPVFSEEVYTISVKEDLQEGSEVLRLKVNDPDSDTQLRFYISDGDPDLQFALDEAVPGSLYLRRALDRETQDSYRLTVVVSDSKYVATAQVVVLVLDVNDERPHCVQSRYHATLAENAAPGTFILTVAVEDPDLQPSVSFHLVGDGADHFYLHKEKGELKTSKLLDREAMPRYSLKAYAYDESHPEWECVSHVELTLTDVNDNAPEFRPAGHKVALSEDSAVGAFITKLTAVDTDRGVNRKIRYYLVNSGENHFEVDKDNAIVRLAKPLDREAQSMFTLIVKAVDSGMPQLWTLTTLQVTVLDVNDNPPEFLSRSYAVVVPENISVSAEIVKVDAVSKDTGINAQIIYTIIEGNEQGKFDLHPITGVISVVQKVDYEQTKWYLLTVLATDQGLPPLSSQTTVNITILDSNDNAPVFSQTAFSAQVPEDVQVGEIVLKMEASDHDSGTNARVGYTLELGDSLHQFSLDLNTGELSVAKTLDRESIAEYSLTVRASDFGTPQLSSSVFVTINVFDVNDNPPTLTQDNYTFFVQEDKMPGWAVGQMIVSDADAFPNGAPFSFSILSGNADLAFRVVSDGTLYTAARLSTRARSVYYLQVRVTDSGFPPLHTDSWITVKIIEESQFAPIVSPLEVFIIAYQERWPGGEIGLLLASDQDPYDTLVFALEASPSGQFAVEPRRGVLTAGPMVDAGRYRLNVSVTDGKFTTHTTVTVHVLPLWEDMLQHSFSIRLRSMTAHHFVLRQWKSLVQLLESALLRQVSLTSLQAASHGDLDVLLTIAGGVELAMLSEALQSAGLSGVNWTCDCHNGALCRQRVQIQRDPMFLIGTDHISFVCPGHTHQLYCACNLGYRGEHCEKVLPGGDCGCAPPQSCVPQVGAPGGYVCLPPPCPPSLTCPPAITASINWEEMAAVAIAILVVSCLVLVFVLYRRCHHISPRHRVDKAELNHVIKRTSKLSNLQVTQPSRPTSYTCSSNNELFSAVALNNADRGTAEADSVPPDYRRNLMSPHHKINNDLKQTTDIPLHQIIRSEGSEDDARTIGGFHWDCSEWLQNGDVHSTHLGELLDSSSYHSNDSCLTGDPARELATLDTKLNSQEDQVIPYGFPSSLDSCS